MTKKLFTILFLLAVELPALAQLNLRFTEEHNKLKSAINHFELGHYPQVKQDVNSYLLNTTKRNASDIFSATAKFYLLMANLAQNQPNAKTQLATFLIESPFASLQQYGYFKLAQYLFEQQDYINAMPFYEKADINYLSNKEIIKRNFELAYCYLINNQIEKVKPLFASISGVRSEYQGPGTYYNGVISYYAGDYDAALKNFEAVSKLDDYKEIVPFYMAEIHYLKDNKDEATKLAKNYISSEPNGLYKAQALQLLSQIAFDRKDFASAEKYFTQIQNQYKVRDEDYFKMGYSYYHLGDMPKAVEQFDKITNLQSTLGAQALFYSALAYLKNGDKKNALQRFVLAEQSNKLGNLLEDVQFNIAKLYYDLKENENAENSLEAFIKNYPNSTYYSEAIEMLALLTIQNQNFDKAIMALNKMPRLSPIFQTIYQKANYARGIQMLIDQHADLAVPYFNETKKYPVNADINGLAEFWKAECYYRLGEYQNAIAANQKFISNPGTGNSAALSKNAYLAIAYSDMHLNEKTAMLNAYKSYIDSMENLSETDVLDRMDSTKPNFVPSHVPFVESNPYFFIYKMPAQDIQFNYQPYPIKPMAYNKRSSLPNNKNYVQFGLGTLHTIVGEFGLDLSESTNKDLYLQFKQRSAKSNRDFQKNASTSLALMYNKNFEKFKVNSTYSIDRKMFRTFGAVENVSLTEDNARIRYLNPSLHFELEPNSTFQGFTYSALVDLGVYNRHAFYSRLNNNTELNSTIKIPATKQLNENTDINLALNWDGNINLINNNTSNGTTYLMLQAGITKRFKTTTVMASLAPTLAQKFHLLPNVSATTYIPQLYSNLTGGFESDINANSFKSLSQNNPWLTANSPLKQSTRYLLYAGLNGSPRNNFNYSLKGGFGWINNFALYNLNYDNYMTFNTFYDPRASIAKFLAQVEYHIHYQTNIGGILNYEPVLNLKNYEKAYHYIPFSMDYYAKYVFKNALQLRGDVLFRSGPIVQQANGNNRTLNSAVDVNFMANYHLKKHWSLFLEINNLLNNKYQRWYQYPNYGTNVVAGLVYSFTKLNVEPSR